MPPWAIDLVSSGINKDRSTFCVIPSPLHSGQAPKGALNENNVSESFVSKIAKPSLNLSAVSNES